MGLIDRVNKFIAIFQWWVWANCSIKLALENDNIVIPDPAALPYRTKDMLFICIGNDAFPLLISMMKIKNSKIHSKI